MKRGKYNDWVDKIADKAIINEIKQALIETEGNVAAAARLRKWPERSLWDKLKKYNINPKDYRIPDKHYSW